MLLWRRREWIDLLSAYYTDCPMRELVERNLRLSRYNKDTGLSSRGSPRWVPQTSNIPKRLSALRPTVFARGGRPSWSWAEKLPTTTLHVLDQPLSGPRGGHKAQDPGKALLSGYLSQRLADHSQPNDRLK
jgi:hypothetical protein